MRIIIEIVVVWVLLPALLGTGALYLGVHLIGALQ